MLRVHPTARSGTVENRLSESMQTPALFPEVSASRAEGMGGGTWQVGRAAVGPFPQASRNSIRGGGVCVSIDPMQFPGRKTYTYGVIARNV